VQNMPSERLYTLLYSFVSSAIRLNCFKNEQNALKQSRSSSITPLYQADCVLLLKVELFELVFKTLFVILYTYYYSNFDA